MIALTRPECPNPEALAQGNYKHPLNKEALRESTSGKCMYCESKIEHISFAQVEHIKPKSKFPELEFSWEKLGYCCQHCNTKKGDKFDEAIPFVDPYTENPEDYLVFLDHFIKTKKQSSERGDYTIKEIDLNRSRLVDRRKDKIDGIKKLIDIASSLNESLRNQVIAELKTEAEKDREYSAAVKSFLLTQGIM